MDGLRTGVELAASAASQTEPARRGSPPPGAYPARLDLAEGGETTREERNAFSRGSEGPSPTTQAEVKDPASAARELLRRAWPNAGAAKRRTSKTAANQGIVGSWLPARAPHRGMPADRETDMNGRELAAPPASQTRACPKGQPPSGIHPVRLVLAEGGETTRELSHELSCGSEGPSPPTQAEGKHPDSAAQELLRRAWPNAGPMEEDLAVETDFGPVRPA